MDKPKQDTRLQRKKPGFFKKTLAGLVITALATLASCTKTNTEFVDVHHWQTPIADIEAISDNGDFTALEVQEKDDWEVYLFNMQTGKISNISNDPINSDRPIGFAGNYLMTISENPECQEVVKIYDANAGQLTFSTDEFNWVSREIISYDNNTKILLTLDDGTGTNVYTHTLGTESLEKLIADATYSFLERTSPDKSLVFLEHYGPSGPIMSIFRTADETITPVLNITNHDVQAISQDNSTAIIEHWNMSTRELKTHDIATNTVNIVNMPAGKEYDYIYGISDNGATAIVMLEDSVTEEYAFYRLDTAARTWDFITNEQIGALHYNPQAISSDGRLTAFQEWENYEARLFNADTSEFYDPLSTITHTSSNLVGFTSDGKVVLNYSTNSGWFGTYNLVLHNPATKTNTPIEDANYSNRWDAEMLSDGQHLVRTAEEIATGWEVVIEEDLINGTKKIIQLPGMDAEYVDESPDGSTLYLESICDAPNLFAYNRTTEEITQITDNANETVNGFHIVEHSKDGKSMIFREYNWNGTETYKQRDLDTGLIRIISYED